MKDIIILILLCCSIKSIQSQEFTISGSTKEIENTQNEQVEIRFIDQLFHISDDFKAHKEFIYNNEDSFQVRYTPSEKIGFMRIRGLGMPTTLFSNFLVFRAGDVVRFNRDSVGNVFFTGKGASLLNYQIWLGKTLLTDAKKFLGHDEAFEFHKQRGFMISEQSKDSLLYHRAEWGEELYSFMKQATVSVITRSYVSGISPLKIRQVDSLYSTRVNSELDYLLQQERHLVLNDQPYEIDNFFYISFLYTLIQKQLESKMYDDSRIPFSNLYSEIIKFDSPIKDKLLAYAVLSNRSALESYTDYKKILDQVKDKKSQDILLRMSALLPGAKLKDFQFEDINGNIVKLSDFIGKTLIIKTWYYGCLPCAAVTNMLKPVVQYYSNNNDVVFLSINADKKRENFLMGIYSGLYGNPQSTNFVFANGLGLIHPMMIYYNFNSAPNLLVINKNGYIVTSTPPRHNGDNIVKEWISLIDSTL